jgi:hypothetical protein
MYSTMNNLAGHKGGCNLNFTAPYNVNAHAPAWEDPEGGSNDMKSPRNAVRLIKLSESTIHNWERSRPWVREDENATEMQEVVISMSSYSFVYYLMWSHRPCQGEVHGSNRQHSRAGCVRQRCMGSRTSRQ